MCEIQWKLTFQTLISGRLRLYSRKVYVFPLSLLNLPLLWSGVGALWRNPRATETEPRESGGGTRDSKGDRGRVGTPYGREDGGRTEEDKGGENWRELDERKGKKGGKKPEETEEEAEENVTEPATGKTKTEAEYYPEEICVERGGERTWKRCEERSGKTDGNWTQGRGRNGKEVEGNMSGQGRRDPWRKLYRTVERTGENWTRTGRKEGERKEKEGEGNGEREGGGNAPGERR